MAKVWFHHSLKEMLIVATHEDPISTATFSPDGKTIATASKDNTTKLWNAKTGYHRKSKKGHPLH